MSKSRNEVITESKKKGFVAGTAATAAVVLGVAVSPVAAAFAAVPAAWYSYKWWKHRAENGIRF
jgi:hypothetical protein